MLPAPVPPAPGFISGGRSGGWRNHPRVSSANLASKCSGGLHPGPVTPTALGRGRGGVAWTRDAGATRCLAWG